MLDAEGNIETTYRKAHTYNYNPQKFHIQLIENGDIIITSYTNQTYERTINGVKVDATQEPLAKIVNTSTYVVGIPFTLVEEGTVLRSEGELTLAN